MSTPPPRPKTAAPLLTPKQFIVVQGISRQNDFCYKGAGQLKVKAPVAKKELEAIAKQLPDDTRVPHLIKLAGFLAADAPKVESSTLAFSKCTKKIQEGKMTYAAFKTEAAKIENLCGGLLVYADKFHEHFKADAPIQRNAMIKLVNGHCESFGKQVEELLKLIDKL
jgi:hypothetical protein